MHEGDQEWSAKVYESCLTILIVFYSAITGSVDEGKVVHGYLQFRKAFNTVCRNSIVEKLLKSGLDKGAARWIENWLNCNERWIEKRLQTAA